MATEMKTNGTGCMKHKKKDWRPAWARGMRRFFKAVREEAVNFSKNCDMYPDAKQEIADADVRFVDHCAIIYISGDNISERAQILAAFTYAVSIFGGDIFHSTIEDVPLSGGTKLMTIHLTQGARP